MESRQTQPKQCHTGGLAQVCHAFTKPVYLFQSAYWDLHVQIYTCARLFYFKHTRDPRSFGRMREFIYAWSYILTLCRLNLLVPAMVVDHKREKVPWCGSICLILNDQHPALPCKSSVGGLSCSQLCWGEYDIIARCLHAI